VGNVGHPTHCALEGLNLAVVPSRYSLPGQVISAAGCVIGTECWVGKGSH
jgi:hypothetical protein